MAPPSPTPHQALIDAATAAGATAEQSTQLLRVVSASPFIAQYLARTHGLWPSLLPLLNTRNAPGDLAARFDAALTGLTDEAFDARLRQLRQQEMIRIGWRDLCGLAETEETLLDLSELADQAVQHALRHHEQALTARHGSPRNAGGEPVQLVVLGMGKLGGQELNYSSDIDLIFLFEEEGETDGARPLSHSEFFTRLGRRLIRSLDEVTAEGFVFRVDMRLRPHGDEGALALPFDAAEVYYTTIGREWERYALIKARVIAGDFAAGARLLNLLKPFVYRKYLDFGAFAQLRDMKQAIEREMQHKNLADNIKLGPGGIREVEFIGQLFQLLRGGREPALQSRRILDTLDTLAQMGELPAPAVEELRAGYDFLRRAENRLQMQYDQQTQTLPTQPEDQARLARAMNQADWPSFLAELNRHRQQIHRHFSAVLNTDRSAPSASDPFHRLWQSISSEDLPLEALQTAGLTTPEGTIRQLRDWRKTLHRGLSATVQTRLNTLMPQALREIAQHPHQAETLDAVLALIDAVLSRSVYLALLIEQPQALAHLVKLCAASPWIAKLIRQQPILLDELIDADALYHPPAKEALRQELASILARFADDEERQFDELRRFRQMATLRVAAADVMGVLPVMRVSDQLTWLAEVVLDAVLDFAARPLRARHGDPVCPCDNGNRQPSLAIIGYGKLGGIELGYGSDLDLVFLHDADEAEGQTTGPKPLDNAVYFARLTQKIIHALSARTPAGVLYEVDTRLRPDGAGGLLASHIEAFAQYQQHKAWLWETQALCRARVISGSPALRARFAEIRQAAICQRRDPVVLRDGVLGMRQKMREELDKDTARGLFHLKRGVGGITDIEFIVQFLLLGHAVDAPSLIEHTDNIRQLRALAQGGVIDTGLAERLVSAYQRLRDASHHLTLDEASLAVPPEDFAEERAIVIDAWQQIFAD
ncbi:bifunctional [glutamate--ammonia ligase]-adenylyl-L-tyrosine phosphorylase/[glutamate--ammonia-ligase] adenylyltransferase [Halothiobacillus sp. DCM-1]|uniref:bifunctional [glutamate--ammonia ligase]-adenylyl-L-tyrosine phosphorylase/[glutamate--ammonia-ligase] adenylyltransferase n=1 Tax=Halothiobacillus sp. DCM-1 TaxID=3112558 RepID=UPI0032492955